MSITTACQQAGAGFARTGSFGEAFTTGDPFKLMRLFGITEQTAMR